MGTTLWIAEPTGVWQRRLRRFAHSSTSRCPNYLCHDAIVHIEDTTVDPRDADGYIRVDKNEWPHDDPRWPTKCDHCEYVFTDDDPWQLWHDQQFRTPDGSLFVDRDVINGCGPRGAMIRAHWMDRDGEEAWQVVLPDGHSWITTQPAEGSNTRWTVTGTAPKITVQPSINCNPNGNPPGWHGFITNGVCNP